MNIEGTGSTPSVRIENGIFEIKGRSIPEDTHEFFSPIVHVIQDYIKNPSENTVLQFHLEYINSGSKKYITGILSTFNEFYLQGKDVLVLWHYDFDDDSMLELGNDLRAMFKIPFQIIEVK
jgi:hypothetical protein